MPKRDSLYKCNMLILISMMAACFLFFKFSYSYSQTIGQVDQKQIPVVADSTLLDTSTVTDSSSSAAADSSIEKITSKQVSKKIIPYILSILLILIGILIWQYQKKRKEKKSAITIPTTPDLSPPSPIFEPIQSTEISHHDKLQFLRDELVSGLELLYELYEIVSKEQNRSFIPINDMKKLLKTIHPENKTDLLKLIIEIANTQGGLLKIQKSRKDGFLVKILSDEQNE